MKPYALADAFFNNTGTAIGDVAAPSLFAHLVDSGKPAARLPGYGRAGVFLIIAGLVATKSGINAEDKSPQPIAVPMSGNR